MLYKIRHLCKSYSCNTIAVFRVCIKYNICISKNQGEESRILLEVFKNVWNKQQLRTESEQGKQQGFKQQQQQSEQHTECAERTEFKQPEFSECEQPELQEQHKQQFPEQLQQ